MPGTQLVLTKRVQRPEVCCSRSPRGSPGWKKTHLQSSDQRGSQIVPHLGCNWASVHLVGRAECGDSGARVMLLEEYPADHQRSGRRLIFEVDLVSFSVDQCSSYHLLRAHLLLVLKVPLPSLDRCHLAEGHGFPLPRPSLPGGALQSDQELCGRLARRGQQSAPQRAVARILCAFSLGLHQ